MQAHRSSTYNVISTGDRTYQVIYMWADLYQYFYSGFSTTCGFNYYKMWMRNSSGNIKKWNINGNSFALIHCREMEVWIPYSQDNPPVGSVVAFGPLSEGSTTREHWAQGHMIKLLNGDQKRIWYTGSPGATVRYNDVPVPGPIIGIYHKLGQFDYYIIDLQTVSDITWCTDQKVTSFTSETYSFLTVMGQTTTKNLFIPYPKWNMYSYTCKQQITITSVTHQIHKGESNLAMWELNQQLLNEQQWFGVAATGTSIAYQVPENTGPGCVPVKVDITCNQDKTFINSTDVVVSFAQSSTASNVAVLTAQSTNPWMEGLHTIKLKVQNIEQYALPPYQPAGLITHMTNSIQIYVAADCKYTQMQYNNSHQYQGRIQNMVTPIRVRLTQNLQPAFTHTYRYRWPLNFCQIEFLIISGPANLLTLSGQTLVALSTNDADIGTYTYTIRARLTSNPTIYLDQTITVQFVTPCDIQSYKSSLLISQQRYVISLDGQVNYKFSFTYTNPCNVWATYTLSMINQETGAPVSPIPNWITLQYDTFPTMTASLPKVVVSTVDPNVAGLYEVTISAYLQTVPVYPSQDAIKFQLILYADKCLLTNFNDQTLADQTFNLGSGPTRLIFTDFTDVITAGNSQNCGPRTYSLSSSGGGEIGNYNPPNSAVPSLIFWVSNPTNTLFINSLGVSPEINIFTTDSFAVGEYQLTMKIGLLNFPRLNPIQQLTKTLKVKIVSPCSTTTLAYTPFPKMTVKLNFQTQSPTSFTHTDIFDIVSLQYSPFDGLTFCGPRTYGLQQMTSTTYPVIPSGLFSVTGTTFQVNAFSQPVPTAWYGLYTILFSVGLQNYPISFVRQQLNFEAEIVPDCVNAAFTGLTTVPDMTTYINTKKSQTLTSLSHSLFTIYNYYCDNSMATPQISYSFVDALGNPTNPSYITLTTASGIQIQIFSSDPVDEQTYDLQLKVCMIYYPTNCKLFPFKATFLPDCIIQSYVATYGPLLKETYQIGIGPKLWQPINSFSILPPVVCVYATTFKVVINNIDRSLSMPPWLTLSTSAMTINTISPDDVGVYEIKIYSVLTKVPARVSDTPIIIKVTIAKNPCVLTQITSSIPNNLVLNYNIQYGSIATVKTYQSYTDSVTVSGVANCGSTLLTVTELLGNDFTPYLNFTHDTQQNKIILSVQTSNGAYVGTHNFKIRATLKDFPTLSHVIFLDTLFSIEITSDCITKSIQLIRPNNLPSDITTYLDKGPTSYIFDEVQDSLSQAAGVSGNGLCGQWVYTIEKGNYWQKIVFGLSQFQYQIAPGFGQVYPIATFLPQRQIVVDPKNLQAYWGKTQIFLVATSNMYPTITAKFPIIVWTYFNCGFSDTSVATSLFSLGWNLVAKVPPNYNQIQKADPLIDTLIEWQLMTNFEYFQDWGYSNNYLCGPFTLLIQTPEGETPPSWLRFQQQKTPTGQQLQISINPIRDLDVGEFKFQYCASLTQFNNKACRDFNVNILSSAYLLTKKPPFIVGDQTLSGDCYFQTEYQTQVSLTCTDKQSDPSSIKIATTAFASDITAVLGTFTNFEGGVTYSWKPQSSYENMQFSIQASCSNGFYTVKSTFQCKVGSAPKQTEQVVNTTFKAAVKVQETNDLQDKTFIVEKPVVEIPGYKGTRPTAHIYSINQKGNVTIKFSQIMMLSEMQDNFDKNSLKLIYMPRHDLDSPGYIANSGPLQWNITRAQGQYIDIQLNFKSPTWVSQGPVPDMLVIQFVQGEKFKTILGGEILSTSQVQGYLPQQLNYNLTSTKRLTALGRSLGSSANSLIGGGMVVTFIFNYAMATMWGVIRGVKFIVFSPLLRMKIPANLSLFLSYLISFATFDYISMSDLLSDWFQWNGYQPYDPYFNFTGFNTKWFLLNVGSPILFFTGALVLLVLVPLIIKIKLLPKFLINKLVEIENQIKWGFFIDFGIQLSLEITVAVLLNLYDLRLDSDTLGEQVSSIYTVIFGPMFALFILATPVFLFYYRHRLEDQKLKQMFGVLWEETKGTGVHLAYTPINVIRRVLFVLIALYLKFNVILQQIAFYCLVLLQMVFVVYFKPLKNKQDQYVEVLNEVVTLLFLYHLNLFNDATDPEFRMQVGWFAIVMISLYLVVSITRIVIITCINLVQSFKNYVFLWQIYKVQQRLKEQKVNQLVQSGQVQPTIELPGVLPSLRSLQSRKPVVNTTIDQGKWQGYNQSALSKVEASQMDNHNLNLIDTNPDSSVDLSLKHIFREPNVYQQNTKQPRLDSILEDVDEDVITIKSLKNLKRKV